MRVMKRQSRKHNEMRKRNKVYLTLALDCHCYNQRASYTLDRDGAIRQSFVSRIF